MRKYLIVVIILVIIGAGASFLLLPGKMDVANMQQQSAQQEAVPAPAVAEPTADLAPLAEAPIDGSTPAPLAAGDLPSPDALPTPDATLTPEAAPAAIAEAPVAAPVETATAPAAPAEVASATTPAELPALDASKDYQVAYAGGDKSLETVAGVVAAHVAAQKLDDAITVMNEYVQAHPDDINGHKKLAELYQAAGKQDLYAEQIAIVVEKDPTEANLKVLSDIYNYNRQYDKQAAVLQRLIDKTGGNNPEAYIDLATIQSMAGQKEAAQRTLDELLSKHPTYSSFKLTRMVVSTAIANGDKDKALAEASKWTSTNPNPAEIADLANVINYGGYPADAITFMEPHRELITKDVDLFVAYVNAHVGASKRDEAYAILSKVHQEGKLPPALYPPYLEIALQNGDITVGENIARGIDATWFDEDQAINLIELARANQADSVKNLLIEKLGTDAYANDKPVLKAIIALTQDPKSADDEVSSALKVDLTSNKRLRLAQACARTNKRSCFDTLASKFPTMDKMTPQELHEFALLYIAANRHNEILDKVGAVYKAQTPAPEMTELAYVKLAAASGKSDVVRGWLDAHSKDAATATLNDLFFLANDRKHTETAMMVSEVLYQRDNNPNTRSFLASAYMRSGQYEKALPLLRQDAASSKASEDNYLAVLTKLARAKKEYSKELVEYVSGRLADTDTPKDRQLQYVFVLINSGNKALAVPVIDRNAKQFGGEWKKLYNQVHASSAPRGKGSKAASKKSKQPAVAAAPAVPPQPQLTLQERYALAMKPETDYDTRRRYAFDLLNDGHREQALDVFQALASDKGPESQDVQQLLYLWGPQLNSQQIAWIQHRGATASTAGERQKWGEFISYYADDYSLMEFVTANPDAISNPSIRKKYFSALAVNGTSSVFDKGMRDWITGTTDVVALQDYASVAKAYGYTGAALAATKRIDSLAPNDEGTLKDLSALSYYQGSYSNSKKYVGQYMAQTQEGTVAKTNPYEAHFLKAELLRRDGKNAEAKREYQKVIDTAPAAGKDPLAMTRYYVSKFHLGQHEEGKKGFYNLIAQNPSDKSLLADFVSILIEYKYYDEATALANQQDHNSPHYQQQAEPAPQVVPAPQPVQTAPVSAPESQGNQPQTPTYVPFGRAQKTSALEANNEIVIASGNYELVITPTQSESYAPSVDVLTPEEEMRRQQELRLQLLYARIELETNQQSDAIKRLNALQQYYPNDPQLLSFMANAQNFVGNHRKALGLVKQAQTLSPENEDLRLFRRSIEREHSDHVKLDHAWKRTGNTDEQITSFSGNIGMTDDTEFGFNLQNDEMNASQVRRADGFISDFDYSRQRGEVFVAHYLDNGSRMQASVFGNNDTAGGGLYFGFPNSLGRSELLGEYHRPYWDFVEAVAENATRDRVGVKHVSNVTPRTTFVAETSYNNYNIDSQDNVAKTALLRATLVHALNVKDPYFAIGYGFDKEHIFDVDTAIDSRGSGYRPFPMFGREIHFVSGILQQYLTDTLRADIVAGYAYDRLGEHGPQVEARLTQDFSDQLEGQVRASYGLESNNSDNSVSVVGGHLKYKW